MPCLLWQLDWLPYVFLSYFQEPDGLNASKEQTNPGRWLHGSGQRGCLPLHCSHAAVHSWYTQLGVLRGSHCEPLNRDKGLARSTYTLFSALLVNLTPLSSPEESFLQIKSYKEGGWVSCMWLHPSWGSLRGSLDSCLKTTTKYRLFLVIVIELQSPRTHTMTKSH